MANNIYGRDNLDKKRQKICQSLNHKLQLLNVRQLIALNFMPQRRELQLIPHSIKKLLEVTLEILKIKDMEICEMRMILASGSCNTFASNGSHHYLDDGSDDWAKKFAHRRRQQNVEICRAAELLCNNQIEYNVCDVKVEQIFASFSSICRQLLLQLVAAGSREELLELKLERSKRNEMILNSGNREKLLKNQLCAAGVTLESEEKETKKLFREKLLFRLEEMKRQVKKIKEEIESFRAADSWREAMQMDVPIANNLKKLCMSIIMESKEKFGEQLEIWIEKSKQLEANNEALKRENVAKNRELKNSIRMEKNTKMNEMKLEKQLEEKDKEIRGLREENRDSEEICRDLRQKIKKKEEEKQKLEKKLKRINECNKTLKVEFDRISRDFEENSIKYEIERQEMKRNFIQIQTEIKIKNENHHKDLTDFYDQLMITIGPEIDIVLKNINIESLRVFSGISEEREASGKFESIILPPRLLQQVLQFDEESFREKIYSTNPHEIQEKELKERTRDLLKISRIIGLRI